MPEEVKPNPEVHKAAAMLDHFEKIQKLPDKVDGVPNFRRVPGYKIFCCGQPTKDGFEKALEKVSSLQNWDLLKSFDNFWLIGLRWQVAQGWPHHLDEHEARTYRLRQR